MDWGKPGVCQTGWSEAYAIFFSSHCDWGPGGPHWVQAFRHVSMELQGLLPGPVVGEGSTVVALQGAPD